MDIRWFGQSAFLLTGTKRVLIDPFGEMDGLAARGIVFGYPPVAGIEADLVLITHEHGDHNAVGAAAGSPVVIRSTAGTIDSPVGEVVAVAAEHDGCAGTERGPNTIFRFDLDGLRICHLGDLGQPALRPEQEQAIGEVDVLFIPVGGGPTVGGEAAAAIVRALEARLVVPMHYRTDVVNFLEPPDAFLEALGFPVERAGRSAAAAEPLLAGGRRVLLLAPPAA
jgi:L-ascorbate metabolism protein UlaG (beta-lactamase superfamily)